jgi:hypothetical protein
VIERAQAASGTPGVQIASVLKSSLECGVGGVAVETGGVEVEADGIEVNVSGVSSRRRTTRRRSCWSATVARDVRRSGPPRDGSRGAPARDAPVAAGREARRASWRTS